MLNFKRVFIAVLCLLFLSNIAFAETVSGQKIDNATLASEVTVEITQSGRINVASGTPQSAEINLTTPQEDEWQQVNRLTSEQTITDSLGNKLAYIKQQNPGNDIPYSTKTRITVKNRYVADLPTSYAIPEEIQKFVQPSKNIQSDDARIKSLAQQITADAKNNFEAISLLAFWVNENLQYDSSYVGEHKDALWVLENKKGVCAEYSTLFTALVRALGIPARYTSLYAYGDNGWESHAVTEVYLGKWIMVDPLWLQVGNVDATHIKYTVQLDNQVLESVNILGINVGEISWPENNYNFETISVKYKSRLPVTITSSAIALKPGENFTISARMLSPHYGVESFTLEPCISDTPIVSLEKKKVNVILEPDKGQTITWNGSVSGNLKENVLYTCPLTLNSASFEPKSINLHVSTSGTQENFLSIIINAIVNFFKSLFGR